MIIRRAQPNELTSIMAVYKSCVEGMLALNIDQWDDTYPNSEIIKQDLEQGSYYVGCLGDEIVTGVNIDQIQDPTYLEIDWKDKSTGYLVIHRLCAKTSVWNSGVGKKMMLFAEQLAKEKKKTSIRLDTYINNPRAIDFYQRLGYERRGFIHLKADKDIYYCFEKLI